jgi:hypothetical protein
MDRETKQRILELGMTAPNVDNAQPFYFRWEEDQLMVFHDENRDRKRGNPENYVSMVGLGCLVECISIAASGEGLLAIINFRYDTQRTNTPWLEVSFHSTSEETDKLLPGLKLRSSDRRPYQGGELSEQVFQRTIDDAEKIKDINLYYQASSNKILLEYLLHCNDFLWLDKHILSEMLSWVRWNKEEVLRTRDGMPWQSLGVNFITSRLMWLVAKSERFRKFAQRSGGPMRAQQKSLKTQILTSAALGCITVRDTRHESLLQLGRLFLRAWIRLNMSGYGVQVMANPSFHVFQHVAGILPDDYPESSKRVFAEGEKILGEVFELQEGEIPTWMFRTGKSSPLPTEMKTLRLPLSRVVQNEAEEIGLR